MRGRSLAVTLCAAVLSACGGEDDARERAATPELVQGGPSTGHVHAVGVDPADGSIVVAAHSGLFRARPGADRANPTGDARDAMGFTVEGPRRYVASGHPEPGSDEPPSVGLIRSTDAGATWTPVSLGGEADLHVLEVAAGGRVYGYDALSGRLLASTDGGRRWRAGALPPVLDLATDPRDPDTVVASTQDGLLRSTDGGRRWRPAAAVAPSHAVWTAEALVLLGTDGTVRHLARAGGTPQEVGTVPAPVAAATTYRGEVLIAADDGAVHVSADGGRSWRPRLGPAA